MSEEKQISRRDFLGSTVWAIGGLITVGLGVPAIAYIIGPALQRGQDQNLIRLGATSKVELGTPTLFKVKVQHKTGWIVTEQDLSIYVRTDDGRNFIAMSNICTHLGCRIRWVAGRDKFLAHL
jgi:menaquinol-cytochrome c reductase iron-sulfur subunit